MTAREILLLGIGFNVASAIDDVIAGRPLWALGYVALFVIGIVLFRARPTRDEKGAE